MNKWTKLEADWNIFRYRNGDTFFLQTYKHFFHCQIRNPEGLKSLQKIAGRLEEIFLEFGYCNTSFGRIKSLY